MTHILLASKSPRRRELIASLGLEYSIVDIDVNEHVAVLPPASQVAQLLAERKSQGYVASLQPGQVLLTADTVVVHNDRILGKPHTRETAVAMLHDLSDDVHQVYTGVCLRSLKRTVSFTECTHVRFRHLSEEVIDYYIDNYKPYDKAGAYGIQEWIGMVGVERIEGCFYNVMGLPVGRLYEALKQIAE